MDVRLVCDDERGIVTLEATGAPEGERDFDDLVRRIEALDPKTARYLLLDFSGLEADVPVDHLTPFMADIAPVLKRARVAKIASVIDEGRKVTSVAVSMLFNMGVRVAIFTSRDDARDWLLG
jgi:hypothetical protein